jgi:signal transduction histidine kinase
MLHVTVQDQGPGVAAEFCERIFEPFQRLEDMVPKPLTPARAVPGTGLGLAIARRAIAAHGGTIRACPGSDGGLCVTILIPSNSSR